MADLGRKTTELPPDLVFSNILPKLPPKSVSRFKCVSKQWQSFLRSPRFLQMHLLHVKSTHNEKYLFVPKSRPWDYRTIDCETPEDGFTTSRPLPFKVGVDQDISILSSVNGMVCVGIINTRLGYQRKISDLILWNPVTGDHKTLPKVHCRRKTYSTNLDIYNLYYIPSENDYKLVWLPEWVLDVQVQVHVHVHVHIFSLKSDSWTTVKSNPMVSNSVPRELQPSLLSNEKYRDVLRKLFGFEDGDENVRRDFIGFVDLERYMYFCVAIINSKGEYDIVDQLVLKVSYRSNHFWERMIKEDSSISDDHPVKHIIKYDALLHSMRNGNWLMYASCKEYIYVLDMKTHTKGTMRPSNMAFHPGVKFIETLVSPNQYNDIK